MICVLCWAVITVDILPLIFKYMEGEKYYINQMYGIYSIVSLQIIALYNLYMMIYFIRVGWGFFKIFEPVLGHLRCFTVLRFGFFALYWTYGVVVLMSLTGVAYYFTYTAKAK